MFFEKIVLFIVGGFVLLILFAFIIACMVISEEMSVHDYDNKK